MRKSLRVAALAALAVAASVAFAGKNDPIDVAVTIRADQPGAKIDPA